jgi:hypothetical protein
MSPLSIAKGLGGISYAEAEQFCLDVRRCQVLAMGNKKLKSIVGEQLKIWKSEARAKQAPEGSPCSSIIRSESQPRRAGQRGGGDSLPYA